MRSVFPLLLLLGAGLAIGSARAQEQDPQKKSTPEVETIALETNLIVLNVTITDDKDQYVSGLKPEDFKIFEDKNRQKIFSFEVEETPFAAAILLDTSGSMEKKLTLERAACSTFVNGIRTGDKFSIYSFGGYKVKKLQDFTEVRDLPDSVWDLRAEGNTPLYDGIVKAAEALSLQKERRRAILIVSDGADTQSRSTLDQAIRKVVDAHASIYAVDMSDSSVYGAPVRDTGAEVLKSLATKTGGRFFKTPGGGKLREAFASAVNELRNQYTITYESSNDTQDGKWRSVEVRLANPKLSARTRQGYYAKKRGS